MNDSEIVERVRSAVDARVATVRSTPPPLGEPSYASDPTPRRRWLLPAALAAAAAVVLGVVIVTRSNDDKGNVDIPASTSVQPTSGLERWILDLAGAEFDTYVEDTMPLNVGGTNVYYAADDGSWGAVVRTNGWSPGQARSSWPNVQDVTVLGKPATLYSDDDQSLLVVSGDPSFIVESYGGINVVAFASQTRIDDGVVLGPADAREVGRYDATTDTVTVSLVVYRVGSQMVTVGVSDHPAGLTGHLLDNGLAPGEPFTDVNGQRWLISGSTAINDAAIGDVVSVSVVDGTTEDVEEMVSSVIQVDEATWQDRVAQAPKGPVATTVAVATTSSPLPRYRAVGTVIEVAGEGVELCLGEVLDSLPPQCDGIPVDPVTWRWPDGTFQEQDGTRWGDYVVDGTYDGTTFTPTQEPRAATPEDWASVPVVAPDFTTPCPEPAGGWLLAASAAPTGAAADQALASIAEYGAEQADFVGTWLDQSINPDAGSQRPGAEASLNDPTKYVVNVAFTGGVERHRAELTQIWTGALCVVERTDESVRQMRQLQTVLADLHGVLGSMGLLDSSIDVTRGVIVARFVLVTPDLQAELDSRFGTGTVIATGALTHVP